MTRECISGLFGRKRAHNFVGCYDRSEPIDFWHSPAWFYTTPAITAKGDDCVKRVTYVRHVCTRCGERIERNRT